MDEFFGEWAIYENDEEKKEALQYLMLWKKFFLKKHGITGKFDENDQQLVDKSDIFNSGIGTLALKIRIEKEGM